jgi:hypothetical protein
LKTLKFWKMLRDGRAISAVNEKTEIREILLLIGEIAVKKN